MKNHIGAPGCLFWTALLLGCPSLAPCQSATTGALAGTVRNPAGDPLPDVTVTLTDAATNQIQTSSTGPNGGYRFGLLTPGTYEARFAAPGFKTARLQSVVVSVSEAPTLDAALEVGKPADQAECQCHLNIVTSSTGDLVNAKTITAVPLTTRNFTQVLSMSSGSAADVNNAGTLGRGTRNVNVNGNTSAGAYSLDGAFAPSAVPNPDTISELKIHTSQYNAVYGAQVPSTALITKSGEKDFHGDAWEFVRNDIFNANAFFLNSTGQPKEHLKQNQFGGTLGGPAYRRKLFFFTSYQGTRQVNGLDQTSTANLFLPPLTSDRSAATLAAEFCPANHLLADGQPDPRYLTFAGGKQLDCRDQSTASTAPINPVALHLLQLKNPNGTYYIPNPQSILTTGANAGLGFSSYSLPSTYNEDSSAERRLSGLPEEYPDHPRLCRSHRAVPDLRLSARLSRRAHGAGPRYAAGSCSQGLRRQRESDFGTDQEHRQREPRQPDALSAGRYGGRHAHRRVSRHDACRPPLPPTARDDHSRPTRQLPPLRHSRQ